MICKKCGSEIKSGATFCVNCGEPVSNSEDRVVSEQTGEKIENKKEKKVDNREYNPFAIAGFILTFFFPLLGLIFSSIGYNQSTHRDEKGAGLSIAGIIVSILFLFIQIYILLFTTAFIYEWVIYLLEQETSETLLVLIK